MAGCCSGGTCSSVQPNQQTSLAQQQEPGDGNHKEDSECDGQISEGLETSSGEAVQPIPIHSNLAEDPELLPPQLDLNLCDCSEPCCGKSKHTSQTRSCDESSSPAENFDDVVPDQNSSSSPIPDSDIIATSFCPKVSDCTKATGTCCIRQLSEQSNDSSQSQCSQSEKEDVSYTVIDIDRAEKITMDVQGMTCVGCEKNLIKALNALPGISSIKTSLLGCKANFDFHSSEKLPDANMVAKEIEKMTGFKCKRILDHGEELELILPPEKSNTSIFLPYGVSLDYRGGDRDRVFLTFNPNSVGARDLLSLPSFRNAKLAPPRTSSSINAGRAHLIKSIYMTVLSALLTIPVLVFAYGQFPKYEVLYGAVSLALATIIQVVVAGPSYVRAIRTLIYSRLIEMDMLVVLSTTTAYVYSVIAFAFMVHGQPLSTSSFFETSTLLVTIIMIGQTLGSYARQQAVESISTESLQVQTAVIVDMKTQLEQKIDARLLQYGDTFKVLPDETVVTDGIIIEGETEIDESMITGESNLVKRDPGSPVVAGSINHSGTILVQLTRLPSENTIKTISALVDKAKSSKPKVQEIADVFAGYFTPAIVILTLIVFVVWIAIGIAVRHEKASTACINAMTFAISTLIVSCPCAIGLAVPMVVVIACGVGARHGIIIKRSETIEVARRITHVVLDKTGTLTQGHPSVTSEEYFTPQILISSSSVFEIILGLTTNSKHPISTAITAHLQSQGNQPAHLDAITSIPGSGIQGTYNDLEVRAGNQYYLSLSSHPQVRSLESTGSTLFCVTIDSQLVALYGLQDTLRPEALPVITALKSRGIEVSLTSGDHAAAVESVATQLGIKSENVFARCTPASKASYITSLLASTPKNKILFIGDGTNDAPALASASIGLHFSPSSSLSPITSSIASSAASSILLNPSLTGILTLINLSEAFHRRVVFNFVWSLVYNVLAISLAAGVFQGLGKGEVRIQPRYAGLGELVSVLPVVGIACSLRWVGF